MEGPTQLTTLWDVGSHSRLLSDGMAKEVITLVCVAICYVQHIILYIIYMIDRAIRSKSRKCI